MNNIDRRNKGLLYMSDDEVFNEQKPARRLTQKLNTMDRSDFDGIAGVIKELFGKSENAMVNPPFYCDYGFNIEVGKNFFCNYNCTILDVGKVKIGDNCLFAPNVSIYTAGHPIHPAMRNALYEYGQDVIIGNNVWLGGNVVVCPGITIGAHDGVGAGYVVVRDIPSWSVAAGNPCRVIREITDDDLKYYFHSLAPDEEAAAEMREIWRNNGDDNKYPFKSCKMPDF